MSNSNDSDRAHLADVDDGAGCTEIWEQLSEQRAARAKAAGRNVRAGGNGR